MIKLGKLLHYTAHVPYHWALLVGLWVFLGCSEVDENGVRKGFVFSPPPQNTPPQAEDFTMDTCPSQEGGFDASFWANYIFCDTVCDVETIPLDTEGYALHCAAGIVDGDGISACWWDENGDIVLNENLGPVGDCNSFAITGADFDNNGQPDQCTAFEGSVKCALNSTSTEKPTFNSFCEVGVYSGDIVDLLGCDGPFCRSMQLLQADQALNYLPPESDFTRDSENVTPTVWASPRFWKTR